MSNSTTNYLCKNGSGVYQDLSDIFQPLNGGTSALVTGFLSNNNDLNTIFLAATSGGPYIDFSTNFIAKNGQDLKLVFSPYLNYVTYSTTGNSTTTTNNGYTFITYNNMVGDASINFINAPNNMIITCLVVGGGGAGGSSYFISYSTPRAITLETGGGGGGGEVVSETLTYNTSVKSIYITIGAGGTPTTTSSIYNGSSSSITYNSIQYTALGGNGGGLYNDTSPYTTPGGAAINNSGSGGNGGAYINNSGTTIANTNGTGSESTSYSSTYSSYSINGYTLPYYISGGGSGGSTSTSYLQTTGSGGTGGYQSSSNIPTPANPGTYGGGGGGGSAGGNAGGVPIAGANGGNGLVIISFPTTY